MASKTLVILEDDLDGGEATQTVQLGYQGAQYEVDLSDKNADKLAKALEPFLEAGRRVGGRRRSAARVSASADASPSDIREWAVANGYDVSARGRVSAAVREAYQAAH